MVEGRNYTSNLSKLLKHLPKWDNVQKGVPVGPVMVHLALTNRCNLDCPYCCYGGRDTGQELTLEQSLKVIDSFNILGTKGLEITGGGDPLLHPNVNEIVQYGKSKGMSIGLITNGLAYDRFTEWDKIDWVRVSGHVFNTRPDGSTYSPKILEKFSNAIATAKSYPNVDVGSVHIYHGDDYALDRIIKFMEHNKIPTRITPDLTRRPDWIQEEMPRVAGLLKYKYNAEYCFVSDFNIKFDRSNTNCWLHLVKPYIHPDGNVYVCPGASFSPENFCNVDDKYKLCSIDDIVSTYISKDNLLSKSFDCRFCKYQHQNDFFNELMMRTKDNDFA